MTITIGGSISFICVYLIYKPNILYGLAGFRIEKSVENANLTLIDDSRSEEISTEEGLSFNNDQYEKFHNLIELHLNTNHPFIKKGYKIKNLSDEVGLPVYLLSAFINQAYGKNFNEFINDYRIQYISTKINNSSEYDNLTMEAIAKSVGFNSRTSFIDAVKKKTGKTPSAYFFNDSRI